MEKAGCDMQLALAALPTKEERIEQLKEEYQVWHTHTNCQWHCNYPDTNDLCSRFKIAGSWGRISPNPESTGTVELNSFTADCYVGLFVINIC